MTDLQESAKTNEKPNCMLCKRRMKYGEIVVFTETQMMCENCAQKNRATGEARILGGLNPSSVDRERAAKNLKRCIRKAR